MLRWASHTTRYCYCSCSWMRHVQQQISCTSHHPPPTAVLTMSFHTPQPHHTVWPTLHRPIQTSSTICKAATKDPKSAIKRVTRDDVIVQFVRSSGAGGQNVNKVSTKVDMRFNVRKTEWLEDDVKEAIERMERNRINKSGELVISSQRTRSQADNLDDALQKLQEILDNAWISVQPIEEDPAKKKKLEKQKKAANENRLKEKKFKADKKKERRSKVDW